MSWQLCAGVLYACVQRCITVSRLYTVDRNSALQMLLTTRCRRPPLRLLAHAAFHLHRVNAVLTRRWPFPARQPGLNLYRGHVSKGLGVRTHRLRPDLHREAGAPGQLHVELRIRVRARRLANADAVEPNARLASVDRSTSTMRTCIWYE